MEKIQPQDNRMYGLITLYDMHTDYFLKAIDGIWNEDAQDRKGTKANHVAWLAGSVVHQRYDLAETFTGISRTHAGHELFKDNQGIRDDASYPALEQYKNDWEIISPITREALLRTSTEKLGSNFEMMPGMVFPYYDLVSFSIYREANMIGQIALWRRLLGYEPLNYM